MRGWALGLAVAGLVMVGCQKEPRVIQAPAQGGAGTEGGALSPAAPVATRAAPVLPGELVRRGTIRGRVRSTGPTSMIVDDEDNRRFYVQLNTNTRIFSGGRPSSALSLDTGTALQLSFVNENGRLVATRIDVMPREPQADR